MEYCALGGDLFVSVLKRKVKPSKIRIQKSSRPDNVKGGRTVRTKTLVSLTEQQFKSLVGSKKKVLETLHKPQEEDIVQKALDHSGVELRQKKNNNDDWDSLVRGEAPQGSSISSWMRELWNEEKKKKKKKNYKQTNKRKKKKRDTEANKDDSPPTPSAVPSSSSCLVTPTMKEVESVISQDHKNGGEWWF